MTRHEAGSSDPRLAALANGCLYCRSAGGVFFGGESKSDDSERRFGQIGVGTPQGWWRWNSQNFFIANLDDEKLELNACTMCLAPLLLFPASS